MKTIGYMEGTNSEFLTNLLVDGIDTLPLSNGWDNHGKFIAHLNKTDNISIVVGYLHKFFALSKDQKLVDEILSPLKIYKIPTVFIVPKDKQDKAKKLLKGKGLRYFLADPADLLKDFKTVLRPGRTIAKKVVKKKAVKKVKKAQKRTTKKRRR